MRFSTGTLLVAFAAASTALAAPAQLKRQSPTTCPAVDDEGSPLTSTSDEGQNIKCQYTEAGSCEYFKGNGTFSSGASKCPGGLVAGDAELPAPSPSPSAPAPAPPSATPAPEPTSEAPIPTPEIPTPPVNSELPVPSPSAIVPPVVSTPPVVPSVTPSVVPSVTSSVVPVTPSTSASGSPAPAATQSQPVSGAMRTGGSFVALLAVVVGAFVAL